MSNPTYQVKGWNTHFEGAKSRTYSNKSSTQLPSKHGLGYKRIVKAKNGAAMFGAWCALCQVLSRHPKPRAGFCTHDGTENGRPYTPDELEIITDIPAKVFSSLFEIAPSEGVDWMTVTTARIPDGCHADTTRIPQAPMVPSDSDLDSDLDSDTDSKAKPDVPAPHGEFQNVMLLRADAEKLERAHGQRRLSQGIDVLSDYIEASGKKYKSHYAVLKKGSWVWDKVDERKTGQGRPAPASNGSDYQVVT